MPLTNARSHRSVFAIAALAGLAGPANANLSGYWNSATDFYVRVNYMPDLDQVREALGPRFGLPNDGLMYCVPTACTNLFAYIERHGFENNPGVGGPGVLPWGNIDGWKGAQPPGPRGLPRGGAAED